MGGSGMHIIIDLKLKAMQAPASKPLSFSILLSSSLILIFISSSLHPAQADQPLLTPIKKDTSTNLYSVSAYLKTPLQHTNLHLDLGASLTWVDCTRRYKSSTYRHLLYNASLCLELDTGIYGNCFKRPGPSCFNDSCEFFPENSVTRQVAIGDILLDSLALPATDGRNPGKLGLDSDFVFSCGTTKLLRGLARGVTGLAALGRFNFSLPAQLSRAFSSPLIFAICLPSTPSANGAAFFNSAGPYYFLPGIDLSKSLIYTPLLLNPYGGTVITYPNRPSDEYFIGVTSIKVNGNAVPLNKTLLAINQENGFGGTKVTTSTPYTLLQTSIFKAFTAAFEQESAALNLSSITPVKPFSLCYEADKIASTRVGPAVPTIDLVLQSDDVFWRIFGPNSMVSVKVNGVNGLCLGFVDGGPNPRTSIVIGGHQIEDNLLQFDLVSNRLGFSSSVLFRSTTCSNFNFITNK
ncbi:probable aspartic proteinase GIP2 [Coffea arabica]|uniref:Probable aspartic proteinase GIP2 n=1 Tax=Coffea arabica TaxID=13443 RepID=A0A6P6WJT2_COFAR|nr:basic 7S globulin-like [Coffea arabica]